MQNFHKIVNIFWTVCITLANFGAVLNSLKLSKKGLIIINYVLHKTAGTEYVLSADDTVFYINKISRYINNNLRTFLG